MTYMGLLDQNEVEETKNINILKRMIQSLCWMESRTAL